VDIRITAPTLVIIGDKAVEFVKVIDTDPLITGQLI